MNAQLEAIQALIRMNREAARELAKVEETTSVDFVHINHALSSIQKTVRTWKPFTGDENRYYGINVRFYNLNPEAVPSMYQPAYNLRLYLYTQTEQIFSVYSMGIN